MALKIVSSASRCPTRIPIFCSVTSREKLRSVWNKHSWREADQGTPLITYFARPYPWQRLVSAHYHRFRASGIAAFLGQSVCRWHHTVTPPERQHTSVCLIRASRWKTPVNVPSSVWNTSVAHPKKTGKTYSLRDKTHDDGTGTFLTGDNSTEAMATFEVSRDQGRNAR